MSHHTAGPWYARQDLDEAGVGIDAKNAKGLRYTIAMASYMGTADPEPAQANARLIAAAPEMLEALKRVTFLAYELAMQSPTLTPSVDWIIPQAREAIAKAEGKVTA